MKLAIENIKLRDSISILEKLSLKGMKSIHRTRLINDLSEKLQRVAEEERELRKEHCNLDEEGNPIVIDGKYDVKDMEEFQKDMGDFYSEKVVIRDDHIQESLSSIKQSLEESEVEWAGREAYDFEYLYSAFKNTSEDESMND